MAAGGASAEVLMSSECQAAACDFCGVVPTEVALAWPGKSAWDIICCGACGAMRMRTFPTDEEIAAFYQEQYYRGGDASRFPGPVERLIRYFRLGRARLIDRLLQGQGRVLDVGCGRGLILAELQRRGYEVAGTQMSQTAAEVIRREHGIEVHLGELDAAQYPGSHFDMVVMLHVLEHTAQPAAYLREIYRVLKPGGWFLVEVPNAGCATARQHGLGWLHWDLPHHLYHFDAGVLRKHLESCGFSVEKSWWFSLEYGPFGVLQAWLNACLPGSRHYFYRALSGLESKRSVLFAIHFAAAVCLTLPAVCVAAIRAGRRGQGDIVTYLCKKAER